MPPPNDERRRPSGPRLKVRGLRRRFGATQALDGVDLDVAAGEVVALAGENGAGKSTLVRILSGAIAADAGAIELDGLPFSPRDPAAARRAGIATIHQELSLAPHLTVAQNIVLGAEPVRGPLLDRRTARQVAQNALVRVGHPELPLDALARELSAAQRQVVEIARAVGAGCRVLVLDEPTSSLGRRDVERLLALVRSVRSDGTSVIFISHALEELDQVGDRCVVLRDGRVSAEFALPVGSIDRIVEPMVGRDLSGLYPRTRGAVGEVLLTVEGLGGAELPIEASLELRRGEVLGIAGLMGSGRSELLRTIFGLDPVRRGLIRVAGNAAPATPMRRWRQGVGLVSEDRAREGLARSLSLAENMGLPRLDRYGIAGLHWPPALDRASRAWIKRMGIRCRGPRQAVRELSGGNQQKVAMARLLECRAELLLLDEPTRGIDIGAKAGIYALIDALAAGDPAAGRPPAAVLVVSSSLPELLGLCDRIAVMARGRLGPARPVADWTEETIMRAATGAVGKEAVA